MAEICFVPRLIQIASDFSRQAGKFVFAAQRSTVLPAKIYVYFINELRNGFIMKNPFKAFPSFSSCRRPKVMYLFYDYKFNRIFIFTIPPSLFFPFGASLAEIYFHKLSDTERNCCR